MRAIGLDRPRRQRGLSEELQLRPRGRQRAVEPLSVGPLIELAVVG
jgi:hypothetical protein